MLMYKYYLLIMIISIMQLLIIANIFYKFNIVNRVCVLVDIGGLYFLLRNIDWVDKVG